MRKLRTAPREACYTVCMFQVVVIIAVIFSVILHEVAHGYAADVCGDPTPRQAGRLTLNPIPHVDLFGTVIIPAFLIMLNTGVLFGWAKPVPYNPYNLRGRWAEAFVAGAGVLMNFCIAFLFSGIYHATVGAVPEAVSALFAAVVFINIFLALLNLLPIPPLDGAKLLTALLPFAYRSALERKIASLIDMNNIIVMILVLLFIFFVLLEYLVSGTALIMTLLGVPWGI